MQFFRPAIILPTVCCTELSYSLNLNPAKKFFHWKMNDLTSELQFTQTTNPTTGKFEWVAENRNEHDYITDIARSSYADMLHDTERNRLYYKAIKLAVAAVHNKGQKAKVLDIGTGTGLLSMMAATAGAEEITAVEVFTPMAEIARKIIKKNGFSNIKVINKHSKDVILREDGDMKEKANILVTELFDTELIGEGALSAYQHAHCHLMEEDCIAVPHRAITFATIVESDMMTSWQELKPIVVDRDGAQRVKIIPDEQMKRSCGIPAVHDIQLSQFPLRHLKELTNPVPVFHFMWGDRNISDQSERNIVTMKVKRDGNAQVVLSWWDLEMDVDGKIILSTAPHWHHPTPNAMQWRDHWIQSVYFLPNQINCKNGSEITLEAFHDAYSLWFEARLGENFSSVKQSTQITLPTCNYPPRLMWSRPRLGRINDENLNRMYVEALENMINRVVNDGIALCISDFSLLPLMVAQTCFKGREVIAMEQSKIAQRGLVNLSRHNSTKIDVVCGDLGSVGAEVEGQKIALLVAEPFFTSSYLPWHDLYFWYARSELDSYLHPDFQVMPCRAHLCVAAVQFKDLWKIRAPVGSVEGFDVSPMDQMIEDALEMKEYHEPEPHALWEYPNCLLTSPSRVMTFDFKATVPESITSTIGKLPLTRPSSNDNPICHGMVLWMEYDVDDRHTFSTGLQPASSYGNFDKIDRLRPVWCMHNKQAVYLFKRPVKLSKTFNDVTNVNYDIAFYPQSGDVKMKFNVS